jgi:cyclopropane fatty-acyl-phospholipid synthase-like methyltransferase
MDPARFSTIAHRDHAYCNPVDPEVIDRVLDRLGLDAGRQVLDIGCGKAALLVRVAERCGARGVGVDINAAFLAEGRALAERLGVSALVQLHEIEASRLTAEPASFDAGICIGSTHALGGYRETLRGLSRWVRPGGAVLIGEGYWRRPPDPEYLERLGAAPDEMTTHEETIAAGVAEGLEPRDAWVSSERDWDRYEDLYARTVETHVATHAGDPDAAAMRERIRRWRETYQRWGRDTLGFGLYLFTRPQAVAAL